MKQYRSLFIPGDRTNSLGLAMEITILAAVLFLATYLALTLSRV